MDINMDPTLPLHLGAIFCLAIIFLVFHIGYDTKERAWVKQQRRLVREEKRNAPRAKR
jgi:hypothetical protein